MFSQDSGGLAESDVGALHVFLMLKSLCAEQLLESESQNSVYIRHWRLEVDLVLQV